MKTSTTLLVICLVVVGYLLSPPPVLWLITRGTMHPNALWIFEQAYKPAGYLYDACPPYKEVVEFEYRALGLK